VNVFIITQSNKNDHIEKKGKNQLHKIGNTTKEKNHFSTRRTTPSKTAQQCLLY